MALTVSSSIGVFSKWRTFDGTWKFEYTQLYKPDGTPEDQSKYPEGTIFFDSDIASFTASSSIKNVYIDKVPITVKSSNIQYTSVSGKHRCSVIFDSKTPIDPGNLLIKLGPTNDPAKVLYSVNRKTNTISSSSAISDISISRNADLYTLEFTLTVDNTGSVLTDDMLNDNQVYVSVWNIAANTVTFSTTQNWKTIISESDISDASPLIITFVDPSPANRIVYPPNEGSIKVIVQNPNADLFDIVPTIILEEDSIGAIFENKINYDYATGTAEFYVKPINETGYVVVSAWLSVNNTEIDGALKTRTFATAMDGEWIGATEGRLIKFKQNVPKYLKNDNYASFVQATEDFFNTVYTSMSNGKHISLLEKIARINNFNDIKAMEAPLIEFYRKQYGINVQPNNDDLNFYLRNKQLPNEEQSGWAQNLPPEEQRKPNPEELTRSRAAEPANDDTSLKKYVFRDITGLELNSFIKDIYKNIPYYNQMSGTYRGIKFILNQIGLCVKLVEIWSSRNILDNFDHSEDFAREDELNAGRYDVTTTQISDIGRYYLTSRFDVDVMETGLTFKEFNELSYNIVKLILKVKPIHRVLRKLAYVHVTNTNIHFQDFLLDRLGGSQECKKFRYTWNLFDRYAAKKTTDDNGVNHTWVLDNKINADMVFFTFNTVDAKVKYTWDRYNTYGEDFGCGISDGSEPKNSYADVFLNKHVYEPTPDKKPRFNYDSSRTDINPSWPDDGYVSASKNSYNNLYNIEEKLKRSFCKKIGVHFLYLELVSHRKIQNGAPVLYCIIPNASTGVPEQFLITAHQGIVNTINPIDGTIGVPVEEIVDINGIMDTYTVYTPIKIVDMLMGKLPENISPIFDQNVTLPDPNWVYREFTLGSSVKITSETNGFRFNLLGGAQTVLSEIGVGPYYDKSYSDYYEYVHEPVALFARIADFKIALGTDYIMYEKGEIQDIESTYTARKYVIIENNSKYTPPVFELSWFAAGNETSYYLLKKGGDRENPDDWIQVFNKHDPKYRTPEGARNDYYTYIAREGDTIYDYAATSIKDIADPTNPELIWYVNAVYLDDENWPVVDNLEDIELDKNKRPIVIVKSDNAIYYSDTDLAAGQTLSAPITLTEEKDCLMGQHFMIVEESKQGDVSTIIYRFSDDYINPESSNIYPSNFDLATADGEFAISYKK